MNLNDKFLSTYKQLEAELKLNEQTILDYEGTLSGVMAEQLKSCRIMRNYMAHNDLEFLSASNNQIKFLNDLIAALGKNAKLVKDETKKISLLTEKSSLQQIAQHIKKYNIAPIQTNKGLYLVDEKIFINAVATSKLSIPAKIPKYKMISPKTRLSDADENSLYIVTADGTNKGKYIGIFDTRSNS